MTPTPDTPDRTPEETLEEAMRAPEWDANTLADALRFHGHLVAAPTEEQIERAARGMHALSHEEPFDAFHPVHQDGMRLKARAALTAVAGVAPQAPANPVDTSPERVKNQPDFSHVAPQEPSEYVVNDDLAASELSRDPNGWDEEPAPQEPTGECTCPSGDGSLRWPCPTHPPAPSPVREKRWTLRPSRDDGYELAWFDGKRTEGWWLSAEQVDALRPALAAVPDETELAEVLSSHEPVFRDGQYGGRCICGFAHPSYGGWSLHRARAVREWWEKKR